MATTTLSFTQVGNEWQAEATVTGDYNLHLEREGGGSLNIFQRATASGQYMVCSSAVMRISARMRASFIRTRLPRPRMRMRRSALAYALYQTTIKTFKYELRSSNKRMAVGARYNAVADNEKK